MNFKREAADDRFAIIVTVIVVEESKLAIMSHSTAIAGELHIEAVDVSKKLDKLQHSSSASFIEASLDFKQFTVKRMPSEQT